MKQSTAVIEMCKDGTFTIFPIDTKSLFIGSGKTTDEAKADFENSYREVLELHKELNKQIPDDLIDISFVYKYDLRSYMDYYNYFHFPQLAKRIGIRSSIVRMYRKGQFLSGGQIKKIQDALRDLGKELAAV